MDKDILNLNNPLVKEWVGDSQVIIEKNDAGTYYVVAKHGYHNYRLLRFFMINGKTYASVDLDVTGADDFITKLVETLL